MQPYNYQLLKPDYYSFTTDSGTEYHCYFYTVEEIFSDYPSLAQKVYAFNLVLKNNLSFQKGLYKRIAVTVTDILKIFLHQKENAVVYLR